MDWDSAKDVASTGSELSFAGNSGRIDYQNSVMIYGLCLVVGAGKQAEAWRTLWLRVRWYATQRKCRGILQGAVALGPTQIELILVQGCTEQRIQDELSSMLVQGCTEQRRQVEWNRQVSAFLF